MSLAAMPGFRPASLSAGAFRESASGERFVTENPATGRPLGEIAAGGEADIDLAVGAARARVRGRPLVAPLAGRAQGRRCCALPT